MYCTQCGLDVGDEANFCRRCGADLRGLRADGENSRASDEPASSRPPQAPPVSRSEPPAWGALQPREPARPSHPHAPGSGAAVVDGPQGRVLQTSQGEFPIAGFGVRLGGFVVDMFFYFGVAVLLTIILYGFEPDATDETLTVISWLVGMLAEWYFNSVGWSPGKRVVGLRIVREDGQAPGPGKGLGRTVGAFVSGLAFGLGYLWAAWDGRGQTWHDKMAETYVVRRVR